jgi:hypothetical protein
VRGSYFGDTDIFRKGIINERDSTAKVDYESDLFVLSRVDIMELQK